ncbi:sensor histidine kinase [Streptomyces aurantiacus]|uniref:sensor histidine kinase n=1 Tax=Streptomyces aurantiacus TaxID=47760 RepID=UPI001687573C|nr:histidine kinase [Streptomyces aurantiacus]
MTSQVSEDSGQPPVRPGLRGPAGVPGRIRDAAAESWAAVRAAPRRTVRAEGLLCALTAAFGLIPLLLVTPDRPVLAALEALWATLLVAARRTRPVAAVLGVAPLVVGVSIWTLAAVPLIVLSATRRIAPTRRAWQTVGTACAVVVLLTVVLAIPRWRNLPLDLAGNGISAVLLVLLPALAGTLLGQRRFLVDLLRERNAYLEQARSLSASTARLEERNRIASEMHDLLGHRLSLISVHAGALELAAARQAPPLSGQAELLRTTAGTAMAELREILGVLRHDADTADESGSERGTREDITALVAESRRTGGAVELGWSVPDAAAVDDRTRQAVHRVVREGLTNVLKHASGAPTRVEVRSAGGGIEVSVTNGVPRADNRSQGGTRSGLAGLQERISLLGGGFEAGALADGGFRVAAWLPLQANGDAPTPTPAGLTPGSSPGSGPGSGTGSGPGPGVGRSPLSDEVLTWPRVLGAGCAAVLVVLPTVGFLVFLLLTAALR